MNNDLSFPAVVVQDPWSTFALDYYQANFPETEGRRVKHSCPALLVRDRRARSGEAGGARPPPFTAVFTTLNENSRGAASARFNRVSIITRSRRPGS
ncbi:hypothetical protein EVAR_14981_1 [Eumeta japonica]|uniref:Uncharacterized protein n=1 Tax=Eumeta variegata TaxID=151549 RepID=A0A4C1X7F8_EUMVA|nr:hypothetical protein EVAR_14981_1 [Eumeta japonica]